MTHWFRIISKFLLVLWLVTIAGIADANITLTLDRTDIREHETFHLRVQVDETNTLDEGANASFIPDGITIRSRQQFNRSIVVNGKYSSTMGWDFELLATQAGTYTIPSITIGNERSEPFTIRVLPAQDILKNADNTKLKLRADLSNEEVYVQQQLIFTVRIYRSVVARNQKLTPIRVTNAVVEQLGDNKTFNLVKGGNNFRVVEQRYAIFPQQSGEMVIEPMTYSATILDTTNNRSPWQRSQLKPVSLSTQKYTVTVKPKPQKAVEPWLPATQLTLEANWQPQNQTFTVGDPATLDFIIRGSGLLKTQLPTVSFPQQEGVAIYRDSPQYRQGFNRFGVYSEHFENIVVIPGQAGEITIPEIKIPWWNVETDQQEYAVLPAQTIKVEPSSQQLSSNNSRTVIPQAQQVAMQQNDSISGRPTSGISSQQMSADFWQYISFGLAAMWLVTLLFWFRQKQRNGLAFKHTETATANSTASLKQVIKYARGHQAENTGRSLLHWLKNQSFSDFTNLNQFAHYCRDSGQIELADELDNLQKQLYSNHAHDRWHGSHLAKLLTNFKQANNRKAKDTLPEIYKNTD